MSRVLRKGAANSLLTVAVATLVVSSSAMLVPVSATTATVSGDTWSGVWSRNEIPGGKMFLTETGNVVSGTYNWNDGTGRLGGTTSGVTLSGAFHETHYQGSFELKLEGTQYSGSYTGINKDTNGDIAGSFSGKCLSGACLENGKGAGTDENAELELLLTLASGSRELLTAKTVANYPEAAAIGQKLADSFALRGGGNITTRNDSNVTLDSFVRLAAIASASTDKNGKLLAPTVGGVFPVLLKMMVHARDLGMSKNPSDRAEGLSYSTAATRLFALALAADAESHAKAGPA
jgi:hypothetical protein